MSIKEIPAKIKSEIATERFFAALLIVVVGVASFGLGRLSVEPQKEESSAFVQSDREAVEGADISAEYELQAAAATGGASEEALYVASKNSDKYHLPWCGGAQRISDANKVWFSSKKEAEAAGYMPASNCKGI